MRNKSNSGFVQQMWKKNLNIEVRLRKRAAHQFVIGLGAFLRGVIVNQLAEDDRIDERA